MPRNYPYYFAWANNPKRATMIYRPCRIVATGKMGLCMIEFRDGGREIVSRRALRKMPPLGLEKTWKPSPPTA
jgi:hypothetical protein